MKITVLAAGVLLAACTPDADDRAWDTTRDSSVAVTEAETLWIPGAHRDDNARDSTEVRRVFTSFLQFSLLDSESPVPASLNACEPEWSAVESRALAAFALLELEIGHDTVVAAAETITVAEVITNPSSADSYVIQQQVRIDTLHWTLIRHGDEGEYGVCGYSIEGVDFLRAGTDPSAASWVPQGSSWATARQLADSIRRMRRPPAPPERTGVIDSPSRESHGDMEFGFVLPRDHPRRGFATEIGRQMIALALPEVAYPRVLPLAHPENDGRRNRQKTNYAELP